MTRNYAAIEALMSRIDELWASGRFEEGYEILESTLLDEPGYGKAHSYMGWYAYARMQDYELAERHYLLALKFSPGFAGTYINFTIVLIATGKYGEAIKMAQKGMNVGGSSKAQLLSEIGRAYEYMGMLSLARGAYIEAYLMAETDEAMEAVKGAMARVRKKRQIKSLGFAF
jgi:tetratricopeptide (TPR) repeat protein